MTEQQIQNPGILSRPGEPVGTDDMTQQPAMQQQQQAAFAGGVTCHKCGFANEPEAAYCAQCGAFLRFVKCPHCGGDIDPEADYCELCHHYVRPDVCSFCGASFSEQDIYCPECGQPRGGIVCPTCHTLNDFSFCKQCGQPLTEGARAIVRQLKQHPQYRELVALAKEYSELQMQLPYETEADRQRDEELQQLRRHVLTLLAQDQGEPVPDVKPRGRQRVTKQELADAKQRKLEQLSQILDRLAQPPSPSPAAVRNYAMAQKPQGVNVAWRCNYKNALHSSPCGCAKPQMGGKWVVLGYNARQEIKDDK